MSRLTRHACITAFCALAIASSPANGQCVTNDIEAFGVGTAITTQIEGVVFYVIGQSCGGNPPLYMRVADEFYGDDFSSKVLLIDGGCPDFSDDYVRMVFTDKQSDVRFSLGPWATSYTVRVYSTPSGGAPVTTKTVAVPGTGFANAHYPVKIARSQYDIRRIEIEATDSGFEAIDNLMFGMDSTPPNVVIDYPPPLECVDGELTVTGIVCDEDGAYDRDRLEYMRAWPSPQTEWTLIREYVGSPVCETGSLYSWDTTEPEIIDGEYALRVTAINACGMESSKQILVHVDNSFDSLQLRNPEMGDIVGGGICFDGTAWDRSCFDHYVVRYRPASGGTWYPVDQAHPQYNSTVTNDPLALWTDSQALPDGDYSLVVAGYTATGATTNQQISVTLDNTAPTAQITSPGSCEVLDGVVEIEGTAFDANIDDWVLSYFDPFTHTWKYINDDSDNVSGSLGSWDTSELTPCFYLLRLRVRDNAIVHNCADRDPHVTDFYLPVAVGRGGDTDLDFDGDTDLADFALFQAGFTGPLP